MPFIQSTHVSELTHEPLHCNMSVFNMHSAYIHAYKQCVGRRTYTAAVIVCGNHTLGVYVAVINCLHKNTQGHMLKAADT